MKKIIILLFAILMLLPLNACFFKNDVQIAVITTPESGLNTAIENKALAGVIKYAEKEKLEYKAFSADDITDAEILKAIDKAAGSNAEIIVCTGKIYEQAVNTAQNKYSDIHFIILDGVPETDKITTINANTHSIKFKEQEAGFLAGYSAIAEGNKSLGFIADHETDENSSYGMGYIKGIEYAAEVFGVNGITVKYWYTNTTEASTNLKDMVIAWYSDGTEIIFSCGPGITKSIISAANKNKKLIIGSGTDRAGESERTLTSAVKDYASAVENALDSFYENNKKWDLMHAGRSVVYGISDNMVLLPTSPPGSFRFDKFTTLQYHELYQDIKDGTVKIPEDFSEFPDNETVSVIIIEDIVPMETSDDESSAPDESSVSEESSNSDNS